MLKRHFLLLGLIASLSFIVGCAHQQELIPYPKKENLLFERSNNFYKNLVKKKYDQMYAMLGIDLQSETPRDEYIQNLTKFFAVITVHPQPSEVVKNNGTEGTTRTIVVLHVELKTLVICTQLNWVWEQGNWYILGDGDNCIAPSGSFKQ